MVEEGEDVSRVEDREVRGGGEGERVKWKEQKIQKSYKLRNFKIKKEKKSE